MKSDFLKPANLLNVIKSYFFISLGVFIFTIAWKAFVIPYHITGGGAAGVGTILYYLTGGVIPVGTTIFAINAVLVIVGIRILGNAFGAKTIYAIILLSIMFDVINEPQYITRHFNESDKLICAIIAGILSGVGVNLILKQGGSAGGTDIVVLIVSKYRNITPGKVYLYADLIIIGSSFFVEHDLRTIVYGYVMMAVFSYTVDLLLTGEKQSVQLLVFSPLYNEIADKVVHEHRRGVTAFHATGWYSKEERRVLVIVVRKYELNSILQIIKSMDPDAFISVASVIGVYGKGFDLIKTKTKAKSKKLI